MRFLKLTSELDLVPFRLSEEVLEKLLDFDRDSQSLNFPKDAPNQEETLRRIRQEFAEEPGGMQLIVHGTEIVGCLFLKTRFNPYRRCKFLDLRNIYLAPRFRGKGVGRRLVETMEAYARQQDCRYLFLGTAEGNRAARTLFESFGFRVTRVLMEKDLG